MLALAVAFVAPRTTAAFAQTAAEATPDVGASLAARRETLFVAMLSDPTNLDVAFEYALLSAQVGDFEAAISTLERMLVFAPGLPRVQLELAVLYYRIGATDTARTYLEAVSAQDLPPEVRARVDRFAAAIERQSRPWEIAGSISAGFQLQSNATAAPGEDVIEISGIPVTLDPDSKAASDANLFALANVHYAYELPGQGDLFELDFTTYNAVYFSESRLDLNLVEVALGPSFSLGRIGLDRFRLGVYGIGALVALDDSYYSGSYGLGLRLRSQLTDRLYSDSRFEFRAVNYENSETYPTVRNKTGEEWRAATRLTALVGPQLTASATVEARLVEARTDYDSFAEFGLGARATYRFRGYSGGIFANDVPWAASLAAGALLRRYDGPDPLIDPSNDQEDDVLWVEAGLEVPFEADFSAFVTGQYRAQQSNYEIRDYDNAVLTVGISKRF